MAPRRRSTSSQHTVAVVVFERTSVFELAVPCEVFGLDRSDMGMPTYDFMVCGVHAGPLTTKGGLFTIQTPYTLDDLDRADTVIVPAWDVHVSTPPELCDALRRAHARGARIASLCSGVFAVAAAGLLEGRRATTHWMWADELARRYPTIEVDPSVLYIDEGDVLTSAGTAAAIDLCLYMVRQDHGAEVANVFARTNDRAAPSRGRAGAVRRHARSTVRLRRSCCHARLGGAPSRRRAHRRAARGACADVAADVRASVPRVSGYDAVAVAVATARARSATHARDDRSVRRSGCRSLWFRRGVDAAHALPSSHGHDAPGLPSHLPRRVARVTRRAARPRWGRSLDVEGCARR